MNKSKTNKLLAIVLAISCVVIVAGVILYALLGFNTMPERTESYTVEVSYETILDEIYDKVGDLEKVCEDAFRANGVSYDAKEIVPCMDNTSLSETNESMIKYTFKSDTDEAALAKAVEAVNTGVAANENFDLAHVFASMHEVAGTRFYEYAWRGAIAIAVGAVAAFVYICIRYGVSLAVSGFVCCVHDALFTAAVFAIVRVPVYAATPLLYAAVAALVSIVLWLIFANKLRGAFKAPENASAQSEELIRATAKASRKPMLIAAAVVCGVIAVIGAAAASGASLFLLPAIVGVAVPLLSTFFIGPEVCIPLRKAFDKRRAAKENKKGYIGKKKASENADAE